MFRNLVLIFVVTLPLYAMSQPSNQWINSSQEYFKIPVARDGIYKLTYPELLEAGFPVNADPGTFQLIHRGVEQAIKINGGEDGSFNPDDYILFYGRKNDGTLDKQLYATPDDQPHDLYNLFSDTTSYFLTVGLTSGKRMSEFSSGNVDGLTPEPFHNDIRTLLLTEQYNPGRSLGNEIFTSTFDPNESWTGITVRDGAFRDFQVTGINNTLPAAAPPQIEIILLGRSPFFHHAEISVGPALRVLRNVSLSLSERVVIRETLQWSDISPEGTLTLRLRVPSNGYLDMVSLSLVRVIYPQTVAAGNGEKIFYTQPSAGESVYLEINNAPAFGDLIFDVTDASNVSAIGGTRASTLNVVVPGAATSRKLFLPAGFIEPAQISKVRFRQLIPGTYGYVIITHPRLRKPAGGYADPVEAFAAYRASAKGGGFDTLVVHTQ
ncbi:MAG TPA: hypothetical protein VGD31_16715, partial [Sphingobacteriaceae bacterium]